MTLRTEEDTVIWRRKLWIAICGGIVLEEALNLSSERFKVRAPNVLCCKSRQNSVARLLSASSSGPSTWMGQAVLLILYPAARWYSNVSLCETNQATRYLCVCLWLLAYALHAPRSAALRIKKTRLISRPSVYEQWWHRFMNPKVTSSVDLVIFGSSSVCISLFRGVTPCGVVDIHRHLQGSCATFFRVQWR